MGKQVSVAINSDGSFSVDVRGLTAPFALQAIPNDASLPTQYSFAAQADVTVNITPFTTLAMFLENGQQDLAALVQDWTNQAVQMTAEAIATPQAQVNANFSPQFTANGLEPTTFDFFANAFAVGGPFDVLLDTVQVAFDMATGNFSVTVSGAAFAFDINIDISVINIGGGTGGGTGGETDGLTITVTAGAGLNPVYTFTGGAVSSLSVMRTAAPTTVVWGITSPGSDSIASPVTHGTTPAGAIQTFNIEGTLTAGVEYRVSVTRLDGSVGIADFTP